MTLDLSGHKIDIYEITDFVREGGMGAVYKGLDNLSRVVAIKFISPENAKDQIYLQRFRAEAEALARFSHPNIVQVYAYRETDFGPCIVMEFVDGEPLSRRIGLQSCLTLHEVRKIFGQVLSAFEKAHKAGIVHRDIKPDNIMLEKFDEVKVIDFGLAKNQKGPSITFSDVTAGSLWYMPPEQIRGLKNVDHRGDIHSIGMTLYESLTGRLPFEGKDKYEVGKMIVEGMIPLTGLHRELVGVIKKAIEKDAADRFQSAGEMWDALERALNAARSPIVRDFSPKSGVVGTTITIIGENLGTITSVRFNGFPATVDSVTPTQVVCNVPLDATTGCIALSGQDGSCSTQMDFVIQPGLKANTDPVHPLPKPGPENLWRKWSITVGRSKTVWFVTSSTGVLLLLANFLWPIAFPPHAFINITTDPSGSDVFVKGNKIGSTPIVNYEVTAGRIPVQIERQQYFTIDSSFVLEPGELRALSFSMKEIPGPPTSEPTGSLRISSLPAGAELFIDGAPTGRTPVTIERIKADTHSIQLREEGFKDFDSTMIIVEGLRNSLEAKMIASDRMGSLLITSEPRGAQILLDGKSVGITPRTISNVREGTYRIDIKKEGFNDVVSSVTVSRNRTSTVERKLVSTPQPAGSLEVTSDPTGAEISIDGIENGKTPLRIERALAGSHSITIKQEGFKDSVTSVTVSEGQPSKLEVRLVPLVGTINVRAKPYGSIYLDDKLLQADSPSRIRTRAQVGTRRVKARHPTYGTWEKQVTVLPDDSTDILFDFDKMCVLSISALDEAGQLIRGDIYVDGKFTERYAPGEIEVRPGIRTIEIRSKKYVSVEAPKVITVEKDQRLRFKLKALE